MGERMKTACLALSFIPIAPENSDGAILLTGLFHLHSVLFSY
jgi:hypothetical protein